MKAQRRILKSGPIPCITDVDYYMNPARAKFGPNDRIVHVGVQREELYVWFERDADAPEPAPKDCNQWLVFVPTGYKYEGKYIGSVMVESGKYVWHIIDVYPEVLGYGCFN